MSEVRLGWNANTEPDLAGYKIYWGTATGVYTAMGSPKDVGNVVVAGVLIDESAVWYFALTAYSTQGLESGFSSETSRFFALGPSFGRAN